MNPIRNCSKTYVSNGMKVLQLTTDMNIGGIANYIFELSRALKDKGVDTIVASAGGDLEGSLDKTGIPHERLNIKTKFEFSPKVLLAAFAIKRIVQKEGVDIIHAHTRVSQVAGLVASRMTGIPMVTTCHGYFRRRLRSVVDTWGNKVIAISAAVYGHLKEDLGVEDKRIELIYSGIDTYKFSKEFSYTEITKIKKYLGLSGKTVIGTIGRLSPVKGQKFFLQAMVEVLKTGSDIAGLVVGSGPEGPSIKSLAMALGIDDRISFVDSVLDTREALSAIDIFVFPSVKEGLGIALLEALAAARPCIASRTGGIEDIIKDRESGILVDVGDSGAIAAATLELLSDENLRISLGQSGRRLVQSRFTLDRMADDIARLYENVIRKDSCGKG
ncbi:MAG: glycosyltransferase family 4 protein [Candidatus Omnitrophica bacterium]|nr:glycosyltransferase family 4 protein [Candidatus Omnitrophota bacterium]